MEHHALLRMCRRVASRCLPDLALESMLEPAVQKQHKCPEGSVGRGGVSVHQRQRSSIPDA
eukprot:CAMPEP_0175823528 /NCGR_PEP_ID=MMETSP0107_2-20121207/10253_1 /TAXON_ID=195067 ORGANISM="Goniomonas pacifica, Strain CCMP1869" /NCGR_SAMPLE_ID=MMETSP0107_2 /ASSEMBLY_ACC=CAM_ASM_000203 /LENGTH=60 /DNA_ID=CAMNT_0017136053 /DNA_START=231 /DNA_END=413 /DNA_ORIENTATION=+